jgi:hypothetical protein
MFKEKYLAIGIGFISFHTLKPWFVQKLKEFNTRYYQYHTKLRELKDGFNNMRFCGSHKVCTCQCNEVCNPLISTHVQHQKWHALDCIKGNCPNCGLKLLKIFPLEKDLEHETLLSWKCF